MSRADVVPPLRRPEFRKLLAISITVALGFGMVIPVLPLYARSFGVGIALIGLIQFVFGLTRFSFGSSVGSSSIASARALARSRVC